MRRLFSPWLLAAATVFAAPLASAAESTLQCDIRRVMTFPNRAHVECAIGYFFAVPTSNPGEVQRLLAMVQIAQNNLIYKNVLFVTFDLNDLQAASYGCEVHNCRRPISIKVYNQ